MINSNNNKTNKYYISTLQSILLSCGIILKRGDRIRIGKKREYQYLLSVDKQIKNIIQFKYGEISNIGIKKYNNLFS